VGNCKTGRFHIELPRLGERYLTADLYHGKPQLPNLEYAPRIPHFTPAPNIWSNRSDLMTDIGSCASSYLHPHCSMSFKDQEKAKRRVSIACDNCRRRRKRCSGTVPCKACLDFGWPERCTVRSKARPQRLIQARSCSFTEIINPFRILTPLEILPSQRSSSYRRMWYPGLQPRVGYKGDPSYRSFGSA
jgi:hypothetical protein